MKNYDEIAKAVFKRRDEYIKKQKKQKKIIISSTAAAVCCCLVITASFGLLNNGIFKDKIPTIDNTQTSSNSYSSSNTTTSENPSSQSDTATSENSSDSSEVVSDQTSSNIPPVTEPSYFMDSIDKINFYSAKKIISDYSLFPTGKNSTLPKAICLNNIYVEYPLDRDKVFTVSMVTYFTIILNDEDGFLAQKLGGTGLVEVAVTENDIEDMGQMITFKKDDNYYTCLLNGRSHDAESNTSEHRFSTHKYIEGFNLVKNLQQENYKFIVHYDGLKVTGFEAFPFNNAPSQYKVDDITFVEDFCVVIFTKQSFTIDMLETFFKDEEELL